ncbi:Rab-GTPase-TBC domain containing protein [Trypanosoma brucei equiperdum]|uniref:Rab-GTPase-TBC domain containing protein n=1 Tax=Trypanosoma brucei equiperdum TaxID=630700 RepID=A0A3L6LAN8_9TRYP|nr:Rab-GTPase-TBC domain containing protein [Trypanosoma brucei equiperdum]
MDELSDIYDSIVARRIADALLQRTMNFCIRKRRSFESLHSLRWRLLTGLLPTDVQLNNFSEKWSSCTQKCMTKWRTMNEDLNNRAPDDSKKGEVVKRKARFEESDSSSEEVDDVTIENPLLPKNGSFYALRYRLNKLCSIIALDVDRIHWDIPLFELRTTRDALLKILSVYCVQHSCEYKQGMHEVAAFVFYLTHNDATILEHLRNERGWGHASLPNIFAPICPVEGVVAVAYYIFDAIMTESGVNLSFLYFSASYGQTDGITAATHNVQGRLLLKLDAQLHKQINTVYKITPTLYLMRWLRLLFLREFTLEQCADLWDVFLSERFVTPAEDYHLENSVVTLFAAVMLLNIKANIMKGYNEAIEKVMRYPSVGQISFLIQEAVLQLERVKHCLGRYFVVEDAVHVEEKQLFGVDSDRHVSSVITESSVRGMQQNIGALEFVVTMDEQCGTSTKSSLGKAVNTVNSNGYYDVIADGAYPK